MCYLFCKVFRISIFTDAGWNIGNIVHLALLHSIWAWLREEFQLEIKLLAPSARAYKDFVWNFSAIAWQKLLGSKK